MSNTTEAQDVERQHMKLLKVFLPPKPVLPSPRSDPQGFSLCWWGSGSFLKCLIVSEHPSPLSHSTRRPNESQMGGHPLLCTNSPGGPWWLPAQATQWEGPSGGRFHGWRSLPLSSDMDFPEEEGKRETTQGNLASISCSPRGNVCKCLLENT